MTLHNLAYHGWTPRTALGQLGLRAGRRGRRAPTPTGSTCCWPGIERAELVNTVSPGFAAEALTPAFGMGLDGALRAKGDRFIGILNGLDTTVWDPATDPDIAAPYSRADRAGKAACRADLLDAPRVRRRPTTGAVIGMIGRLDPQKGFDLLADGRAARCSSAASGSSSRAAATRRWPIRSGRSPRPSPDRVAFIERFDRVMARRIYAGADFFAMPSRFEPCGQGQMIALRYGTPPIVHRVGGLADTVIDETTRPGAGTGFSFVGADGRGAAARRATRRSRLRAAGGPAWEGLLDRGMARRLRLGDRARRRATSRRTGARSAIRRALTAAA